MENEVRGLQQLYAQSAPLPNDVNRPEPRVLRSPLHLSTLTVFRLISRRKNFRGRVEADRVLSEAAQRGVGDARHDVHRQQ